jgi:gliding motility-associated-like protein
VEDTTAPIIICPSDTVVSTDINGCEAAVNGLSPVVIENCAVTDQIWTFSGSTNGASPLFGIHDASGEVFSLDTTLVTYFVTDTAGNVGTCSFNVVVNDSVLPIVICPNNIIVPTEVGFCSAVVDNINIVSASDNCSVLAHLWEFSGSTVSSSDPFGFNDASGQTFNLDTTLVTYTIIDTAGNFSTCSFEVIIVDTIFPVLVCPSDIVVSTDLTDCDAIVNNINIVSSSDNCTIVDQLWSFSGATSANSQSNGIHDASGETFNLDTTIVTYTVIDNSGNSVSCSFEVVVEDTIAPTIICPSDTIVYTTLTSCDTGVNGLSPTIDDNCTVVDQLWSFVGSTTNNSLLNGIYDASGELFNLDTTLVTYFIADNSGNTASCSFEVIVQDTVAPVLTCPADTLVGTDPGLCAAVVNGLELFVFENCSFSTQTWVIGGATVDTSATSGINDVIGVLFNTGVSIVTYTVIDTVGNTSTCQFEVSIEDTEAPVVICPSDTSVYTDPGLCETTVFGIDTVGVTDNCSAIAVLWTISGATTDNSPAFGFNDVSGQVFFGGLNTVTYAGIDAQGNVGTCSFDVTVLDTVPPVITCPFSDTIVYSSASDCGVQVFWTEPVATDNCSFLVTSTDTSGTFFPVGLTEVTYVVTDFGGNTDQCSFEIQVVDTVIPVIIGLPSDTLIFCEFDTVTWDLPSIDEACPNVLVSSTINPGGQLPAGYTTVTYNAEDASGNFANPVSFVVYVHPLPTPAELSIYDVIACESDPYDVSITNYNTNYLYDWIYDTNILLQNDSIYNVYFAESIQSGIYDVVVTGEFGCQNATSFNVTVDLCEISIPQGYSPNNDGINDFFVVDNILAYPETQITIFNRWGAKVYENNDYQNQWAGESENFMNIGGDQLPEGTYYYQIVLGGFDDTPGKGKLFTGYVYLKR